MAVRCCKHLHSCTCESVTQEGEFNMRVVLVKDMDERKAFRSFQSGSDDCFGSLHPFISQRASRRKELQPLSGVASRL